MFPLFFIFKNPKFKYKAEILYFYNLSTEKLQIIYISITNLISLSKIYP